MIVIYVDAPFIVVSHDETRSPVATISSSISSSSSTLKETVDVTTHATSDVTSDRIDIDLHGSHSQDTSTMATSPMLQETGSTDFTAHNPEAQDIKAVIARATEYCISISRL